MLPSKAQTVRVLEILLATVSIDIPKSNLTDVWSSGDKDEHLLPRQGCDSYGSLFRTAPMDSISVRTRKECAYTIIRRRVERAEFRRNALHALHGSSLWEPATSCMFNSEDLRPGLIFTGTRGRQAISSIRATDPNCAEQCRWGNRFHYQCRKGTPQQDRHLSGVNVRATANIESAQPKRPLERSSKYSRAE